MALLCNSFDGIEITDVACSIVTSGICVPSRTLTWEQIAILAISALSGVSDTLVSGLDSAEAETVVQNALCAVQSMAIPSMDEDKLKAVLLYMVNEVVCASEA